MLQSMEFDVVTASDGAEGWNKYLEFSPQVVISDIYMPKKNGLVLLSQIKEHDNNQIVILITGYSHFKQITTYLEPAPDGCLQKPFTAKEIRKIIIQAYITNHSNKTSPHSNNNTDNRFLTEKE